MIHKSKEFIGIDQYLITGFTIAGKQLLRPVDLNFLDYPKLTGDIGLPGSVCYLRSLTEALPTTAIL